MANTSFARNPCASRSANDARLCSAIPLQFPRANSLRSASIAPSATMTQKLKSFVRPTLTLVIHYRILRNWLSARSTSTRPLRPRSSGNEHSVQHWCVPRTKIYVIESGVGTEPFSSRGASCALKKELDTEGKFVVCYVGTIGMAHGLETPRSLRRR